MVSGEVGVVGPPVLLEPVVLTRKQDNACVTALLLQMVGMIVLTVPKTADLALVLMVIGEAGVNGPPALVVPAAMGKNQENGFVTALLHPMVVKPVLAMMKKTKHVAVLMVAGAAGALGPHVLLVVAAVHKSQENEFVTVLLH